MAAKATANRMAATTPKPKPPIRKAIRYRVEIWREEEPEIRVYHFPIAWEPGKLTKAEILGQIGPKLFDWFLSKIPKEQWTDWDEGKPGASIWDDAQPQYLAVDEDIPF